MPEVEKEEEPSGKKEDFGKININRKLLKGVYDFQAMSQTFFINVIMTIMTYAQRSGFKFYQITQRIKQNYPPLISK